MLQRLGDASTDGLERYCVESRFRAGTGLLTEAGARSTDLGSRTPFKFFSWTNKSAKARSDMVNRFEVRPSPRFSGGNNGQRSLLYNRT